MANQLKRLSGSAEVKSPSLRRAAPLAAARPSEVELARCAEFILVERRSAASNGWRSLKLVRVGKSKKRTWWLGWNGDRLSRNGDTVLLAEHHPEIKVWVENVLKGEL